MRFPACSQAKLKNRTRTRELKVFPPMCPLEQVGIDVLGPRLKTTRGNQFLLVIISVLQNDKSGANEDLHGNGGGKILR